MVKGSVLRGEKALSRVETRNYHLAHHDGTLRMYLCGCHKFIRLGTEGYISPMGKRNLRKVRNLWK